MSGAPEPTKAAAMPLSPSVQSNLADLRSRIERASSDTALGQETLAFRCLSEIVGVAALDEEVVKTLYDTRKGCLVYFGELERGRRPSQTRTAALISVDFLEAALVAAAENAPPRVRTSQPRVSGRSWLPNAPDPARAALPPALDGNGRRDRGMGIVADQLKVLETVLEEAVRPAT